MRISKCLFIALFILLLFNQNSQAYLKTQGREIVDSNGQKILLRGFGLGGWLVQEGYQLHIPGLGSPSSIRKLIVDLIGQENANQFYQRYINNYVTEEDIQKIASWGVNSIRLPFNYRLLTPEDQPGVYLEEGFQIIDRLLEWCEKNKLYLILDMHCAPGGQNKDNISDADGVEARLWTNPANQDRTVEIWRKIAERYATKEWIGGYDLLNEPVLPSGYSNSDLRALYIRITRTIREVDSNHIIFIEGNWYATDFNLLTPAFDVNLVYSFHKYWNENTQAAIQNYLNVRNQTNCPLWLGESGENSNTWFHDCVQLLGKNNIGWNWWTHKKIQTTTSPYSSPISLNYQRVLDYWNGQASKPTVEFATAALFQMADDLRLEKCEFRPDVLEALFRPDFGLRSTPYKSYRLPDIIYCVDFDFGREGVAYHDADYQVIHGLGSDANNRGGKYRNDGVDIELSNDAAGAKYNVGWIENGEWLLFTVIVADSGEYSVDFRVASPNSSGKLQLLLDGQPLTNSISIPNTGGWKNWQTISTSENIFLPAGTHSLKLLIVQSGFNINFMKFNLKSLPIKDSYHFDQVTDTVFLAQNYPNPFNQITQIRVLLLEPQQVNLKIFNLNGALVKNVFDGLLASGLQTIAWDGTNSNCQHVGSGLYFYQFSVDGSQKTKMMVLQK
ncbi:cellulase family glycosylhydrolase [candidate division KSB1 bacterium]|nr:cellulase family glycosylhydrolase [candidate division KSB1 bacterium]